MSYGPMTVFSVTMASGATLTSEIDLARSWKNVWLDATGANSEVRFQGAIATGGTYRQVLLPQSVQNTSTAQTNIWKVGSGASGGLIDAPQGIRFLKVETTAVVANGLVFKLICSD